MNPGPPKRRGIGFTADLDENSRPFRAAPHKN